MGKELLKHRHAVVMVVEATNSNPNGDRDNNGQARQNELTGAGEMTDGCVKRKWRDTMAVLDPSANLYIQNDRPLNEKMAEAAMESSGRTLEGMKNDIKADRSVFDPMREYLINKYIDIRAFGATLAFLSQSIKGPVQVTISQSVMPIEIKTYGLTSEGIPTEEKFYGEGQRTVMGEKSVVRHGVYIIQAEMNAVTAEQSGFTEDDKDLLLKAAAHMYDFDKSAARPDMRVRALYDFEYPDHQGLACPPWQLWESVHVTPVPEVLNGIRPATKFSDYVVTVDEASIPEGVVLRKLV